MKEWKNYFNKLINGKEEKAERTNQMFEEDEIRIPQPSEEEIKYIIMKLKNNKNPGPNEISTNMLKAERENCTGCCLNLYSKFRQIKQCQKSGQKQGFAQYIREAKNGIKNWTEQRRNNFQQGSSMYSLR